MLGVSQQFRPFHLKHLEEQFQPTNDDVKHDYNPFQLNSFQYYQPTYKLLFDIHRDNCNQLQVDHRFQMTDLETVLDTTTGLEVKRPIFIKYSPLLDPIRYMIGKYDVSDTGIRTLPTFDGGYAKLATANNASYVDGLFYLLSSKLIERHNFKHAIEYYGSLCAVQRKFKMNVADDFDYLNESRYFLEHVGKLFYVSRHRISSVLTNDSREHKDKLVIAEDIGFVSDVISIDAIELGDVSDATVQEVYRKEDGSSSEEEDISSSDEKDGSSSDEEDGSNSEEEEDDTSYSEEEDDNGSEESKDGNCDQPAMYAYIDNFPVQMICLEECAGTLDDLFANGQIDDNTGASALFQVVMSLLTYQIAFNFTHNDLHTNNVMYVPTDDEFVTYKYKNVVYKVPTYGKLFKIIDFGRSIYKYNGKQFCSDSFAPGGDASTQYNFEPYYNKKNPRLEPNYSFDLCRLGCSIFDFLDGEPTLVELTKTVKRWCLDDRNADILYKKNGDERYPDFKLYKMIAKTVHAHTPQAQLKFPFFNQFVSLQFTGHCDMDLDTLSSYA